MTRTARRYVVPIEVEVEADDAEQAAKEALDLISYAFEVSNDQGIFKAYRVRDPTQADARVAENG